MKKFMRTTLSVLAAAAAITTVSAVASADVIDFENGQYEPYVAMKTNDGGDLSNISVVDFNGSKMLKVDVQDITKMPKVQIKLDDAIGSERLSEVKRVQLDLYVASKDGETPPGWIGGGLGSESLDGQKTLPWSQTEYSGGEYNNPVSEVIKVEHKWLLASTAPKSGTEGITCLLQRWAPSAEDGVPYDMYIDNIKFLDAKGNELDILGMSYNPGADEAAEEAAEAPADEAPADEAPADEAPADEAPADEAPAATEAAPVETAAPVADTPVTTSTSTGNVPAAVFAAVAALAGAVAIKSRRK